MGIGTVLAKGRGIATLRPPHALSCKNKKNKNNESRALYCVFPWRQLLTLVFPLSVPGWSRGLSFFSPLARRISIRHSSRSTTVVIFALHYPSRAHRLGFFAFPFLVSLRVRLTLKPCRRAPSVCVWEIKNVHHATARRVICLGEQGCAQGCAQGGAQAVAGASLLSLSSPLSSRLLYCLFLPYPAAEPIVVLLLF